MHALGGGFLKIYPKMKITLLCNFFFIEKFLKIKYQFYLFTTLYKKILKA